MHPFSDLNVDTQNGDDMDPNWVKMATKIIKIDKNMVLKQGLKKISNKCEN